MIQASSTVSINSGSAPDIILGFFGPIVQLKCHFEIKTVIFTCFVTFWSNILPLNRVFRTFNEQALVGVEANSY